MRVSELQFDLPPELIAQQPCDPRDASRLLVLDRNAGTLAHRQFSDLVDVLRPGDLLVRNDTRVLPARFHARRATGGRIEVLFVQVEGDAWRVLLRPARRLKVGERLAVEGSDHQLELADALERGAWLVRVDPPVEPATLLDLVGEPPLPPYIERQQPQDSDRDRYQTVYADQPGAIAAPTAGLHFTDALLTRLNELGINTANVTLHVGLGTFAPVEVNDLDDHPMHREWYDCPSTTLQAIRTAREVGQRVVAVGTTTVRVLETVARNEDALQGWTDLLIQPPFTFRMVDALITNFHLPGSTLLALIMALATPAQIRDAYAEAIRERYRFFSYGDAMLIE